VQIVRFLSVGLVNTGIGLSCIWAAMYFLGLNEIVSNLIGYAVGLLVSFTLNRTWTFAHAGPWAGSLSRWLLLFVVAYSGNLATVTALYRLAGMNAYLAQAFGIMVYTAISFVGSRYYVFPSPAPGEERP